MTGEQADLSLVRGRAGGGSIPHAALLVAFAEAVLGPDEAVLEARRRELLESMGAEALVDVAAVVAGFDAVDRIADATGIPLDAELVETSRELRAELGLDAFQSAHDA